MKNRVFLLFFRAFVAYLCIAGNVAFTQEIGGRDNTKFVALVIGNSSYEGNALVGPANDAIDMANALVGIGFRISNKGNITNLNRDSMYSAIDAFAHEIDKNTVAVVYYSGHGLEDENRNYLVPVGATLKTFGDLETQLVSLSTILTRLDAREARTKIVILDACRDMPMALRYKSVGPSGGLAAITTLRPGTMVIYAASPDAVAMPAPRGQRNSIFTAALLQAIGEKRENFSDTINRAAQLTVIATKNRQNPWLSGNIWMAAFGSSPLPTNPLQQRTPASLLPSTGDSVNVRKNCTEVSEQLMINGVVSWSKKCI